ncbi:MAG: GntR family transcriptional regulator [Beijerinckiaceae bacterium]
MSAKHNLCNAIEQDIATGILIPGERLDEMSLAARYGVSRTPVREALHLLATSGFIELRPRRGAIVADIGPERLFAMFEVMAELEAVCGRLAARRLTQGKSLELVACHEACRSAQGDPDAYYALNELFHQKLYETSGNPFLAEQCLALQKRLRPYRRLQLQAPNRMRESFAEHERIVIAITRGDGEAAAVELRGHVTVQGDRFSDLVAGLARLKAA